MTTTIGTAGVHPRRGAARWWIHLQNAAKGAVIIGAAVVLGIILLQVIDDGGGSGGGGSVDASGTDDGDTTTTTSGGGNDGGTIDFDPAAIKIVVLNGSDVEGAALATSNELRAQGWVNQGAPGNAPVRTGSVVQCQSDVPEGAAQTLATVINTQTIEPYPDPAPADAGDAQCIVTLGQA